MDARIPPQAASIGITLIPHRFDAGLFSQINFVITHVDALGRADFDVDWRKGTYYSDGRNLFSELFAYPTGFPPGQTISTWPHYRFTGSNAHQLYLGADEWRWRLNYAWNLLLVRPDIMRDVDQFCVMLPEGVSALHVRNCKIGVECANGVAPTLDDYWEVVQRFPGPVFLATDNQEAVQFFSERLGERLFVREVKRSPDMETEAHLAMPQDVMDARNCLIDALIMSRCARLIHGVSNLATAAVYMNPWMEHIYVQRGVAPVHREGCSRPFELKETPRPSETDGGRVIHVQHPGWNDWLHIREDGSFQRITSGCAGTARDLPGGDLMLEWFRWGPERITPKCKTSDPGGTRSRIAYRLRTRPTLVIRTKHGLGNQMFQYAFAVAAARAWEARLLVKHVPRGRKFGLDIFGVFQDSEVPEQTRQIKCDGTYQAGKEREIIEQIVATEADVVSLNGYFQNEKWFEPVSGFIRELFRLPRVESVKSAGTSVAVHVRLGDYVNCGSHAPLPPEYYREGMEILRRRLANPEFRVFSDSPDDCRSFVGTADDIRILPRMSTRETMQQMQACDAFIVGNSTFSWWAAWVKNVQDVICPSRVLPQATWNICPERWTHLEIKSFWRANLP